jgi:hypothetical protein
MTTASGSKKPQVNFEEHGLLRLIKEKKKN